MWKPYLKVVAKKAGHALRVLDRFHIVLNMNTAIDTVRRAEVRELKQRGRLRDLVRLNLKAVRSMLLREDFEPFWRYRSAHWAGLFLDRWCTRVMFIYFGWPRSNPIVKSCSDGKPGSTRTSRTKLFSMRPAPTSRTSASAASETTKTSLMR